MAAIKLCTELQEAGRREFVRKAAGLGFRGNSLERKFAGLSIVGRIDENNAIAVLDIVGDLRGQLGANQDFDIRHAEVSGQLLRCKPADPVIAAEWVAVSDDQDSCHLFFSGAG